MSSVLKKSQNQLNEYAKRKQRVENYEKEYKNFLSQNTRVSKQLNNLLETDKNGNRRWKQSLRLTEGDNKGEYDVAVFNYPVYKRYILSLDKVNIVKNRLKQEKIYMNHLTSKIKKINNI